MNDVWTMADYMVGRCPRDYVGFEIGSEPPSEEELALEIAPYSGDPRAVRQQIDKRLHNTMEALARNAEKGDVQSARALVAVAERRAKMLGLEAPKEVALQLTSYDMSDVRSLPTHVLEQMLADSLVIEGECHHESE